MKIPASVIMPIAHLVERTYKMLAQYGMRVPQLTPSRVRLLSCNRTFNCSKAKSLLGYKPVVSLEVFLPLAFLVSVLSGVRQWSTCCDDSEFLVY